MGWKGLLCSSFGCSSSGWFFSECSSLGCFIWGVLFGVFNLTGRKALNSKGSFEVSEVHKFVISGSIDF